MPAQSQRWEPVAGIGQAAQRRDRSRRGERWARPQRPTIIVKRDGTWSHVAQLDLGVMGRNEKDVPGTIGSDGDVVRFDGPA